MHDVLKQIKKNMTKFLTLKRKIDGTAQTTTSQNLTEVNI